MADPYAYSPLPQTNLLQAMGQVMSIQNAMNQNQLFQQTNRARTAMGHIAQASIGKDGQMDYDKYMLGIAQHPETALIAPELIQHIAGARNMQLDSVKKNMEIAAQRDAHIADVLAPLIKIGMDGKSTGKVGELDQGDIFRAAGQFDPAHKIPPELILGTIAKIGRPIDPKTGQINAGGTYDPAKALQDIYGMANAKRGAAENVAQVLGQLGTTQTPSGQTVQGTVTQGPEGARFTPGTAANVPPQIGRPPAGAAEGAPALAPMVGAASPMAKDIQENYIPRLNERVAQAQATKTLIEETRELARNFNTNAFAGARAHLAALAKAAGMSESVVHRIADGDVGDAQALMKLAVQGGTTWMGQAFEGQHGPRALREWEAFHKVYPSETTDPKAREKIFSFMEYMADNVLKEKSAMDRFVFNGKDLAKFPGWWSDQLSAMRHNHWHANVGGKPARAQDAEDARGK